MQPLVLRSGKGAWQALPSHAAGLPWVSGGHVQIQVLTNAGALDRGTQLAVVERLTAITADDAGDPGTASWTWVLLAEESDGGGGLAGHATLMRSWWPRSYRGRNLSGSPGEHGGGYLDGLR